MGPVIRYVRLFHVLAFGLAIPFCSFAWQQESTASTQDALVNRYCIGCHNAKLRTAGLILEGHSLDKVAAGGELWEKLLRKLEANEMPPSGMPRPPAADMKEIERVELVFKDGVGYDPHLLRESVKGLVGWH